MIALWLTLAYADPAASDAMNALREGKALTARRLAEEALAADPDDFGAHYVVGRVAWMEDGNLPRAAWHLAQADRLYRRDRARLGDDAWRTHAAVVRDRAFVLQQMEDHTGFLRMVDAYNEQYTPKLEAERAWVLMSMERYDEARAVAEAGVASDDDWQQSLGLNVLCALEAKVRDRAAALRACTTALERSREEGGDLTVDAYNAAFAAASALDFAQAEALYREATTGPAGGSTNPWTALVQFELQRGRGAAAIDGIRRMQAWRHAEPPPERAQSRAEAEATLALVLLVGGESERGLEVIERALRQPDRRAHTTQTAGTTRATHGLIRLALRQLAAETAAEQAAMEGLPTRMWRAAIGSLPDPSDTDDRLAIAGLLTDREVLLRSLQPYEDGGMTMPRWLVGDLIPIVGAGIAQSTVDTLRTLDAFPGLSAYHDALEAEIAWRRGQSRAGELVRSALAGLPDAEVLLRARVAAVGADHAWRQGDRTEALALYERALQLDPSCLRRLGLALPATVSAGDADAARDAATMLRRSPRLTRASDGFRVDVQRDAVCLSTPSGSRIGCHRARPPGDGDIDAHARALVSAFHAGAFALPLGEGRLDMRSLDGTTRLDEQARRERIEQVLRGL